MKITGIVFVCLAMIVIRSSAKPVLLDNQFDLPDGFHIYRAAQPELTGGSYDLTFDGQGRLLVGDGKAVRRLKDNDSDGVFDSQEIIAEGLGPRGPQGLLVYGDHLYAVGGDGIQLFSGYESFSTGRLKHERRLGQPFHTGGDHSAHTVLRGLDGYIYFVTGNDGGTEARKHITEASSPSLEEREASVFRFDPEGKQWECLGSGGRNPPSLGMNYLGELFSFDSDMEFHVDVPFYRPVRLNHWLAGGDQGWQNVGAYPPYYLDCLPGVIDVGRGSPNWGVFYEHTQFPERYSDAFIVCDYQWKSATSGQYATSGRLVAFHIQREGARWKGEMSTLARAKLGARDEFGKPINFAVVDVDVAPDGSLLVSDHNQGVWRIFYNPSNPPTMPTLEVIPKAKPIAGVEEPLSALLSLPQPAAEWSRLREVALRKSPGWGVGEALQKAIFDPALPGRAKLRALRLLAPGFADLSDSLIARLTTAQDSELRAQAAWLVGIRLKEGEQSILIRLLGDPDAFVRRRAAEALTRSTTPEATAKLLERLDDPDPTVRYAAMTALSHRPSPEFLTALGNRNAPQILMRVLTAAHLRKQRPGVEEVAVIIKQLLDLPNLSDEDSLNFLRVLDLYRKEIEADSQLAKRVVGNLLSEFRHTDPRVRWERVRLLGLYQVREAFSGLVDQLLAEKDPVTQFHIAAAIGEIPKPVEGWDEKQRDRLGDWLISSQTGWFSQFAGKGLQFPGFWATVLDRIVEHHAEMLMRRFASLVPKSQLSRTVIGKMQSTPNADATLIEHYRQSRSIADRLNIVTVLQRMPTPRTVEFLIGEYTKSKDPETRKAFVLALAANASLLDRPDIFLESILESEDTQVVVACIQWLVSYGKSLKEITRVEKLGRSENGNEQALHFRLLDLMAAEPNQVALCEHALVTITAHHPPRFKADPQCIWSSLEQNVDGFAWFAKSFQASETLAHADLVITCDNEFTAYLNGQQVAASTSWERPQRVEIRSLLKTGENWIAVEGKNAGGPAGLVASLRWVQPDGEWGGIATDRTWSMTSSPPPDWKSQGATHGAWLPSLDVGEQGKHVREAYHKFTVSNSGVDALAIQEYWHKWYLGRYKQAFLAKSATGLAPRSDEVVHRLIAGVDAIQGDIERGGTQYLKAGCFACHGGLKNQQSSIFGPPLAGVTLRLNRTELADAIVYPSKQVVERFRATELTTKDGQTLNGFITELSDDFVSITDLQNQVTRLRRISVESIQANETSLMPEKLLNSFSDQEIRDLLAFITSLR